MTGVNPLYFIVGMALLGLAPFFLMMVTSYVKIVVVTSLVRNALGVQQVPPAMVMNGLAIILSLFIMAPMMMSTMDIARETPDQRGAFAEGSYRHRRQAVAAAAQVPFGQYGGRRAPGLHEHGEAYLAQRTA